MKKTTKHQLMSLLCALVAGCRAETAATATAAASQFYTMREALGGSGAPSAKELTALRPFITDTLARALAMADSVRAADMKQAPDEKPRFVEGDLFSSVFESPTSCRAMPASGGGDTVLVTLECTDNRSKPAVNWTDTAVVVRSDNRWLVHDIRYGGTWDFANKGSLLRTLLSTREPVDTTAVPKARTTPVAEPTTAHWDYGSERGPVTWASLSPEFAACASGTNQSPIDITKAKSQALDELSASYSPAQLRVVHHEHVADEINNGHTIQVNYSGADSLTLGGQNYALLQYHFHSPSENTVEGKHFPMEIHFVHRSATGQLAVLAAFIKEGTENAAYAPVWANLPKQKGMEFHFEHLTVDVDALLPAGRASYRFDGSLTTPPCSEGVKWIVLAEPVQLSAGQIAAFRAVVDHNNRPTQPLNSRKVVTDHVKEMPSR